MFTKIVRTNHLGEIKESVINTDYLISIKEKHLDAKVLYDENGDVAQTIEPTEKRYDVIMKGGVHYDIGEEQYNELVKALIK